MISLLLAILVPLLVLVSLMLLMRYFVKLFPVLRRLLAPLVLLLSLVLVLCFGMGLIGAGLHEIQSLAQPSTLG